MCYFLNISHKFKLITLTIALSNRYILTYLLIYWYEQRSKHSQLTKTIDLYQSLVY